MHSRRVLEMRQDGPVTFEHLEQIAAEHPDLSDELAAELEQARQVSAPIHARRLTAPCTFLHWTVHLFYTGAVYATVDWTGQRGRKMVLSSFSGAVAANKPARYGPRPARHGISARCHSRTFLSSCIAHRVVSVPHWRC